MLVAAQLGWETGGADVTAWSGWLRALGAAALCAVVSLLVWGALSRRGERRLRLSAEHGDVSVPLGALQRLAVATALRHPDVVSAEARLRAAGGAPAGRLRLRVRPMADVVAVAGDVEAQALAALNQVIGRETTQLSVTAEVLSVRQLGDRLQ